MPYTSAGKNPQYAHFTKQWRAIIARDRSTDGQFVYAVLSTGVYCLPSCPSRKPRRDRVIFFAGPQEAEACGFRACRRCRPNERGKPDAVVQIVARACRAIDDLSINSEFQPIKPRHLAASAGVSAHQLDRAFRRTLGVTPRQYLDAGRMKNLKLRLQEGMNVTDAMFDAGYSSSSRLYENSSAHLGMTPATYRQGGAGMDLRYTIVASPLGRLLVAATERGISALYLGDSDAGLVESLRKEYPRARIRIDENSLRAAINAILRHLSGRQPRLDLPTDVVATAFRRRVWEELRKIPYGVTKTYAEVAHAIGKPAAIRAVARACATNPVSVIVPCHRVVRKGGHLAGYRWGLERKQALLEREAATSKERSRKEPVKNKR